MRQWMSIDLRIKCTKNYIIMYYFSGVLDPMALNNLSDTLKSENFVALCTDTSNRGNIKLLPIMVRYYSFTEGIQCKLISLSKLEDESHHSKKLWLLQTYNRSQFKIAATIHGRWF